MVIGHMEMGFVRVNSTCRSAEDGIGVHGDSARMILGYMRMVYGWGWHMAMGRVIG